MDACQTSGGDRSVDKNLHSIDTCHLFLGMFCFPDVLVFYFSNNLPKCLGDDSVT